MLLIIFSSLRKKFTRPIRRLWSFWNSLRMPKLKSRHWNNISSIWNRESLSISQSRRMPSIRSWPNSLTIILRDPNWRLCSWENLKVFTNSVPRELQSRSKKMQSRSELVEAISQLTNSWTNTLQLNLKSLRERILSRDSVKKSPSRKQSLMRALENLLQFNGHLADNLRVERPLSDISLFYFVIVIYELILAINE